ncbi:hypothetical protein WICPIJ_009631 [Wickerhamomyces pijperi]|uniref:Uncharacterized protein n=1 Tax=Wickerhamomyces pijperi TaxID=599730 RepID=A0A9P8PMK6_WICPI|nr:hypothetical protein WICPIJ_009631 [Wickerhamomyces pijperi]
MQASARLRFLKQERRKRICKPGTVGYIFPLLWAFEVGRNLKSCTGLLSDVLIPALLENPKHIAGGISVGNYETTIHLKTTTDPKVSWPSSSY